jgi:hypothetical protein
MSAVQRIADSSRTSRYVRFVPDSDMSGGRPNSTLRGQVKTVQVLTGPLARRTALVGRITAEAIDLDSRKSD